MSKAANYSEVKRALENLRPFHHATCHAEILPAGETPSRGRLDEEERGIVAGLLDDRYPTYVVYSYGTPIGYAQGEHGETRYVVAQKFSVTTSKQQTYLRAAWSK